MATAKSIDNNRFTTLEASQRLRNMPLQMTSSVQILTRELHNSYNNSSIERHSGGNSSLSNVSLRVPGPSLIQSTKLFEPLRISRLKEKAAPRRLPKI